jgi:hypothetical protein
VYRPNAFITSSVVIGAGGRLEKVIIVCPAKLTIPTPRRLLPMLCTRSSRPSRKNVCDRELSSKFDVAAVSKIHFNVIFSKAAELDGLRAKPAQLQVTGFGVANELTPDEMRFDETEIPHLLCKNARIQALPKTVLEAIVLAKWLAGTPPEKTSPRKS